MKINNHVTLNPWSDVKNELFNVNSQLANIIEKCKPQNDDLLIKVKYPVGFPIIQDGVFHLIDDNVLPVQGKNNSLMDTYLLDYDWRSIPLGAVLSGGVESYWKSKQQIISNGLLEPGFSFAKRTIFDEDKRYNFQQVWNLTSGYRSIVMLPSIGDYEGNKRISKKYKIRIKTSKSCFYEQHETFVDLLSNASDAPPWFSEVLLFTKPWLDKMADGRYKTIGEHLRYQYYQKVLVHHGHKELLNYIWHEFIIKLQYDGYKTRPYIYDFVKNIILVALGHENGLAPVVENNYFPVTALKKIYINDYKIKYAPILMAAKKLNWSIPGDHVYISLQLPMQAYCLPSRKTTNSGIDDVRDIKILLELFYRDIKENKIMAKGSVLEELPEKIKFDFFHTDRDVLREIKESKTLASDFIQEYQIDSSECLDFPHASLFFKGCIKITNINSS